MLLKAHSAILAAILTIATVLPVSAQGFNAAEVKRLNAVKQGLPDIGRAYSIRVTTGATTNAGFENALVESDPNLKHWCWVPVTNFNQAYIHVAPGEATKGQAYQRPKSVYVKPQHVPLPKIDRSFTTVVNLPKTRTQGGYRSNSDVHATLSYAKEPPARAYSGETKVYSYGDVSGRLNAPRYNTAAYSESKDVYGKLVSRTTTH